MTKVAAINQHGRNGDQKRDEVLTIVGPDTVHQPDTVVVVSRNAGLTKAAMLAARWLEELASATFMARMKKDSVVWIASHFFLVVLSCDK